VFWSDPDAQYPTSAVCWNAGVTCTGGPGTYDACSSANKTVNGNDGNDGNAVLQPVSRYSGIKSQFPGKPIRVFALTGVPEGYATGDSDIVYQDSPDPVFQGDFGIGPGCADLGDPNYPQVGLPPVRVREVANAFRGDSQRPRLHSICSDDYAPALQSIADRILQDVG
jgi:hypothetical protein